jgi:NAD(P)-dependent dehydrogenase (short-subunit alcohol dehydrogenase family)
VGELDGKVAVITGAGSGMARAAATVFVREGARVLAADVSGPLDVDALSEAFDLLLQSHPVLGGHLEKTADGRWEIVLDDLVHPGIEVVELFGYHRKAAIRALRAKAAVGAAGTPAGKDLDAVVGEVGELVVELARDVGDAERPVRPALRDKIREDAVPAPITQRGRP